MTRGKSNKPRRLPPPRSLSRHRRQLSHVAEQLLRALHHTDESDRSRAPPSGVQIVRDIVDVVIESATLGSGKHCANAPPSQLACVNTHGDGAPVRGGRCIDTADTPRHGEQSPMRSKKNERVFGAASQPPRVSPPQPESKPSPPKAVVDPHTSSFAMPKSKHHVEVLDDDATDDEVIFLPKPSARPKHARAGPGAGKRTAGKRGAPPARAKRGAASKSSPVAPKPTRRRAQGAEKTRADEKRDADHSEQTADRHSSGKASTSTKRVSAAKTTRSNAAGKANPSAAKLKPSKVIAKRSTKPPATASAGSKSKPPTKSEKPRTSKGSTPQPSTKPSTKRLVKQSPRTQHKSTRSKRNTLSDSHPPQSDGRHKQKHHIRKEPEQQPEPAEEVEEPRICHPPLLLEEKEEANYPHSDISSDVDLDIENTACTVCSELGDYAKMVLCDACAAGCHIYCMQPQRSSIPLGTWLCPSCHIVAKRHRIHLSRMAVLREEKRCYDCVQRNVKTYNSKSPVKTCSDCALVFHSNCLRRFHNMKLVDIQKKDWTCEVCLKAEEKRKEEEAAMLAKQRARLAQKRARVKRPRLPAPYIGGAGAPRQQAPYHNSKPATFVATSFPPVPIGNPPHFHASDIMTDSPTPQPNEEQAVEEAADLSAGQIMDRSHSSPRPRIEVSISTDDRVKRNTQCGYGTPQDPVGPMRPASMPPNGHGGNSQSRTTSIPVANSGDAHTSTVRREAPNPIRFFSNQINSMPSALQGGVPLERRVAEEHTERHEMRHKVREWNENVQNSVNDMFRYHEPSLGRRASVVTSEKSKSKSKPVIPDDTIPAPLYNSNAPVGVEQDRMLSSMLSQGSNVVQNDVFPQTFGYGRWQGTAPQETGLRQDPRSFQPRDSVRFGSLPQPPVHAPSGSMPPLPEDHFRSRRSPPGPTPRLNGNPGQPIGSSLPERNQASERNDYQSTYRIPPSSSFDPSALPPYLSSQTHEVTAHIQFQSEALRDIPPQKGNTPKQTAAAPVLSERNSIYNHGVVKPSETVRYGLNPNSGGHRGASEPHRQQATGSAPANTRVNDHMTGRFGLTAQQRSESCGPSDVTRIMDPNQSKRPASQSQTSGQAALMRAALTQAANHVGYSQCHAQNGKAVLHTKTYNDTGVNAQQKASSKGFSGRHLDSTGEPRPQEQAGNVNLHVASGGAKSTVSVAEKGTDAAVNSAPLSPAPLQKSLSQSNALEEPLSSKGPLLGSSGVVQTQDEPEFVESGSLRAWIMLNICPRKRFHGSMFLDMPYRSYFSGAVRVLYDESRSLRVVAFSKFDCETSHCRLKEWWISNRSHFSLAPEHFPDEGTLTTACLSDGFRLDVL